MDKQNLRFFFTFLICATSINIFFNYWDQHKIEDKARQIQIEKEATARRREETRQQAIVPIESFKQLRTLAYPDHEASVTALEYEGIFFTFNPDGDIQNMLIDREGMSEALSALNSPIAENSPQLFGSDASALYTWISWGRQEIKELVGEPILLWNTSMKLRTAGAMLTREGQLLLGEGVEDVCIACLQQDQQWIPFGYFDPSSGMITPLAHHLGLDLNAFDRGAIEKNRLHESSVNLLPPQRYVLQNSKLQLVINTQGGSIEELNLPLATSQRDSSVRSIEIDRLLQEEQSPNAHFPLRKTFKYSRADQSIIEGDTEQGGYYPLLRRELLDLQGLPLGRSKELLGGRQEKSVRSERSERKRLELGAIYDDDGSLGLLNYEVLEFNDELIKLRAQSGPRTIIKTFRLKEDMPPYCFEMEVNIEGDRRGLWVSSGILEAEAASASVTPQVKYRVSKSGSYEIESLKLPKETTILSTLRTDWALNSNGFFGVIIDAIEGQESGLRVDHVSGEQIQSRYTLSELGANSFQAAKLPGYQLSVAIPYHSPKLSLRIFAGPLSRDLLKQVDTQIAQESGSDPQYEGTLSFVGWFSFILRPFSKAMMILMNFFHTVTGSWTAAILLLTVTLRALLFPLNAWSFRSMKRMTQLSPKVQELQKKYEKDSKRQQLEIMELYKREKVSPVSGCLPILIQLPFLLAMLSLLRHSVDLRGAPFIHGWIDNLAAPDVAMTFPFHLPFIGNSLHILPILHGIVTFIQQRLNSPAISNGAMTDSQRQQRAMGSMMTILFVFMFYHLPSGLNIYWLVTSILGIIQQRMTHTKK